MNLDVSVSERLWVFFMTNQGPGRVALTNPKKIKMVQGVWDDDDNEWSVDLSDRHPQNGSYLGY